MGALPAWRVPPASTLHWRHWDDEFVVYHEHSGDTHRLNALGASALKHLVAAPMTAPSLVARLRDEFDAAALGDDAAATVDNLLQRFADLGLIEAVSDDGHARDAVEA